MADEQRDGHKDEEDHGITFSGPAVKARLSEAVSDAIAGLITSLGVHAKWIVYAGSAGLFWYIFCEGLALVWK